MKALSMTQPWAALYACGAKRNETRSWKTNYRGVIAIHAAIKFPTDCTGLYFQQPFLSALQLAGFRQFADLKTGVVIGTCKIVDCVPTEEIRETLSWEENAFGDYSNGRWAWVSEDARLLDSPIACRGALSLWELPAWAELLIPQSVKEAA